jgi:competence protein ComEA
VLERWSGAPAPGLPEPGGRPPSPIDRHRLPLTALLVVLLVLGGALWLARLPLRPPVAIPTPAAAARVVKVHVVGAVARPGLYELPEGGRVADALEQAGGVLPLADVARLNLALRVRDGQQVVVPTLATATPALTASDAPSSAPAAGYPAAGSRVAPGRATRVPTPHPGAPINLNRATQEELEALPGIGPATARRILDHRQRQGPFQSTDELRTARLVTPATWERIKELVAAP